MNDKEFMRFLISLVRATGIAEDIEDLCRFLVIDTLSSLGVIAAVYLEASKDGLLKPRASYGISPSETRTLTFADARTQGKTPLFQYREPIVLSPELSLCTHPSRLADEQENLLIPALSRSLFVGALVLVIEPESALKQPEEISRATRLIQESISSVAHKSLGAPKSEKRSVESFDFEALSPRQKEIVGLLDQDLTNLQIARYLRVSESLVKKELVTIYRALGTSNRAETVAAFREQSEKV